MKEIFRKNLKFLREKSGKNQTEVGSYMEKSHTSIGNWEKGLSEPSMDEIVKLASFFGISAQDLLFKDLENDVQESPQVVAAEPEKQYTTSEMSAEMQKLREDMEALKKLVEKKKKN